MIIITYAICFVIGCVGFAIASRIIQRDDTTTTNDTYSNETRDERDERVNVTFVQNMFRRKDVAYLRMYNVIASNDATDDVAM